MSQAPIKNEREELTSLMMDVFQLRGYVIKEDWDFGECCDAPCCFDKAGVRLGTVSDMVPWSMGVWRAIQALRLDVRHSENSISLVDTLSVKPVTGTGPTMCHAYINWLLLVEKQNISQAAEPK